MPAPASSLTGGHGQGPILLLHAGCRERRAGCSGSSPATSALPLPCGGRKKEGPVIYRKGLQKAWSGLRLSGGHISHGDLLRDASPPSFLEGTFSSSPRLFGGSSIPGLVPNRAASSCLCVQESGAGTRSLCRVALFPLDVRKRLSAGEEEGTAEGIYSISCCQSLGHAFLTSSPKSSPALSPGPSQAAPSSPSAQK